MSAKWLIICLITCVISVVVIFLASTEPSETQYESRARYDVMTLRDAIKVFVLEKKTLPLNLAGEVSMGDITSNCIEVLLSSLYLDGDRDLDTTSYVWLDPWRNPYKIAFRNYSPGVDLFRRSNAEDDCIVWSFGENGIDEFGQGDDIAEYIRFDLSKHRDQATGKVNGGNPENKK